jgi:hypothetical protein
MIILKISGFTESAIIEEKDSNKQETETELT